MKLGPLHLIPEFIFLYVSFMDLKHGSVTKDTGYLMDLRGIVNKHSCFDHLLSPKIKGVVVGEVHIIRGRDGKKEKASNPLNGPQAQHQT